MICCVWGGGGANPRLLLERNKIGQTGAQAEGSLLGSSRGKLEEWCFCGFGRWKMRCFKKTTQWFLDFRDLYIYIYTFVFFQLSYANPSARPL